MLTAPRCKAVVLRNQLENKRSTKDVARIWPLTPLPNVLAESEKCLFLHSTALHPSVNFRIVEE